MKGNPRVLEYLVKAVQGELAAQNQYWLHAKKLDNWGIRRLAKHWMAEVKDERGHCDRFLDRIVFLEGDPNVAVIGTVRIGTDIDEILANDLTAEREAVALYTEAAKVCHEVGDFVSRDIFEATLADEEGHVNFLETELSLFGRLGPIVYAQTYVGKPE